MNQIGKERGDANFLLHGLGCLLGIAFNRRITSSKPLIQAFNGSFYSPIIASAGPTQCLKP